MSSLSTLSERDIPGEHRKHGRGKAAGVRQDLHVSGEEEKRERGGPFACRTTYSYNSKGSIVAVKKIERHISQKKVENNRQLLLELKKVGEKALSQKAQSEICNS